MVAAAGEPYPSVADSALVGALLFVLVNLQRLHRTVLPSADSVVVVVLALQALLLISVY